MSNSSNKQRAFYEAPKDRPIASSIINQARKGLGPVQTKRPDTPKTNDRSMFYSQNSVESRPNSSNIKVQTYNSDLARPVSSSKLIPLNKTEASNKQRQKVGNNNEVERHKFQNVKTRTNSMTNLALNCNKEGSQKSNQSVAQSESFATGLPPTSPPTKINKRVRNKSQSFQQSTSIYQSSNERISSADSQKSAINAQNYRPDSASSCSSILSNSSSQNAKIQTFKNKDRTISIDGGSIDEVETPRPQGHSLDDQSSSYFPSSKQEQQQNQHKIDDESPSKFFRQQIKPILDILGAPIEFRRENSTDDFIKLTKLLYQHLHDHQLLGKSSPYRSEVLKAVFKVLDTNNEVLVMSAARIILSMKVRDINLTNICKLIFNISKNKNNDFLFKEYQIPELLLKTLDYIKPDKNANALLYITCILKFLSSPSSSSSSSASSKSSSSMPETITINDDDDDDNDDDVSKQMKNNGDVMDDLIKYGLFEKISNLLDKSLSLKSCEKDPDKFANFLTQCLYCLINLKDDKYMTKKDFVVHRISEKTAMIIEQYYNNHELIFVASRLLSRLTDYSDCCGQIEKLLEQFCPLCLNIMLHSHNDEIVLRISFIIGNLLAKSEDARHYFFPSQSTLESFLSVLQIYMKKFQSSSSSSSSSTSRTTTAYGDDNDDGIRSNATNTTIVDIIVKLLRVIANAAISDHVGRIIANSRVCIKYLLVLIGSRKVHAKSELLTTSISTLNNLSFYLTSSLGPDIEGLHMKIIEALYKLVLDKSGDNHLGLVIRVLGNLSRESYMRQWIVEHGLDEFLVTILDSGNQDTVFFSVGVLLNLMTDSDKRYLLLERNAISKLLDVLRDYASVDWQLAGLVCQTLWNYTESMSGSISLQEALGGIKNTEELIHMLYLFTNEEEVELLHRGHLSENEFKSSSIEEFNQELDIYQTSWSTEFLPVANDLLIRLESLQNQ